jgi:hypothetical protein
MYSRESHNRYTGDQVTVRYAATFDRSELAELAALDSATAPSGPVLVAEADARLVAALPLGSGRPIADPFRPSDEVIALLRLRAEQLARRTPRPSGRERLRALIRAPLAGRLAPGSLRRGGAPASGRVGRSPRAPAR